VRLNNRAEIMWYLGKSPKNKPAWRRTRSQYAEALHYLPGMNRLWTTSEALDAVDRARSLTVAEVLASQREAVRGARGSDYALESLARKLYPSAAGTRKRA
jgi:hypothetical protein